MSRKLLWQLVLITVVASIALAGLVPRAEAGSSLRERYTVRLYSGTQVVGTWQAIDAGRVEGDSFVFRIDIGVQEGLVRIQGTYSVEPVRR